MEQLHRSQTNRLLGYPDDARLLIVNADDFGMCHAVNDAIALTLQAGVVRSTTLMVPCPWALHAMGWLSEHPDVSFGVHLTAIGDSLGYRWRPLTPWDSVPSLVDEAGFFWAWDRPERMPWFLDQVDLHELETEFRAQIEAVLVAGLKPDHLDWHSLRIGSRPGILDLILGLAREYGLAMRVFGRESIEKVQNLGLPTNDYDFLDSSVFDSETKTARFAQLLRELPAGLSEWAVHPGIEDAELQAIEPNSNHFRQADFDFLMSAEVHDIIKQEGIVLLSYGPLQAAWQNSRSGGAVP